MNGSLIFLLPPYIRYKKVCDWFNYSLVGSRFIQLSAITEFFKHLFLLYYVYFVNKGMTKGCFYIELLWIDLYTQYLRTGLNDEILFSYWSTKNVESYMVKNREINYYVKIKRLRLYYFDCSLKMSTL